MSKNFEQTFHRKDIEMANEQMKRCSASFVTREMLIKTPLRSHNSLIRKTNSKKSDHSKLMKLWRNQISHTLLVGMSNGTTLGKSICHFLKKTKHKPILTQPFLEKESRQPHKDSYAIFLLLALFVIETQNNPNVDHRGEWINKSWFLHVIGKLLSNTKE